METIDIIIVLLLLWGAVQGWRHGLIKEVVSMAGFFVGLFLAYHFYESFGNILAPMLSGNPTVVKYFAFLLAFVIIWVVVPMVLGFFANVLTKSLKVLHLGGLNSFLGMLVGVLKYLILMSFVFCAMDYLGILKNEKKANAQLYKPVASLANTFFEGKTRPWVSSEKSQEQDTIWIDIHHDPTEE